MQKKEMNNDIRMIIKIEIILKCLVSNNHTTQKGKNKYQAHFLFVTLVPLVSNWVNINCLEIHSMNIPTKFGCNWSSDCEED
jgi:hypothetical protein